MLSVRSASPLTGRKLIYGTDNTADRGRLEGAMHQTCSFKRIEPWSVPQVYCIVPERRFRSACQPEAGRFARGPASRAQSNRSVGSLNRLRSMLWACSASPLALRSDRGKRERGCGRPTGKIRLNHCSIGRSRERVPRGSYTGIKIGCGSSR